MYASERIDEQLNKETARELNLNLSLVDQVIRFQFRTGNEATTTSTSIEFTGLGVFKAIENKIKRKLKTYARKLQIKEGLSSSTEISDRKKHSATLACKTIEDNIAYLSNKEKSYEN